ncbi:MAG: hypothetical protein JSR26_00165 [Proteobacteria bacterium]|nr:hypothetical protein [Pseudomonadota bacterium]
MQSETDHEGAPQVVARQVKEKFGSLRFHAIQASERQRAMIRLARVLSLRICEGCGAPGTPRETGRHATLCDAHADARNRG